MVNEFCGFKHGVIGTDKMPADTTLNNMKKADLIKLLHTAQHNYETLNWFYNNAVKVNMAQLKNNGWIPCSERLPNGNELWLGKDITDAEPREFIVMVKGAYEPTTGYYTVDGWVKDIYDKDDSGYANEIIAWRFFPAPYKEGCD